MLNIDGVGFAPTRVIPNAYSFIAKGLYRNILLSNYIFFTFNKSVL